MTDSPQCRRCETLPPKISGPGVLHLQFPLTHTLGKVLQHLSHNGSEHSHQNGTISIRVSSESVSEHVVPLLDVLSATEQIDVRAIFQRDGQLMQLQDYFEVEPLQNFAAKAQSSWLIDMMESHRLTSWFQPIVSCQSPEQVCAYECLMRGRDGDKIIFPGQILSIARGAGLLFQLDLAARRTAIHEAARHGISCKIFINFTPTSIYDPVNCLKSTVQAVDEVGLRREQVVFEVIESDQVHEVADLNKILDYYRANGFGVALDDVGSGYSSLNLLGRLRPDYIKLDRELTQNVHEDNYKAMIAQKLLETAQELDITSVAEGVESEGEYHWLREHNADYVQGYYFARPASPPPLFEQQVAVAVLAH